MIIEINSFNGKDERVKKAIEIRFQVFVNEQNVSKHLEYDGLDFDAVHYLITVDKTPVATARWRETEEGIKLERFAVLKEYRGLALGILLLKYILREVIPSKKAIYLHAQESAVGFYEKFGFYKKGESFNEADIIHYNMFYNR